MSCMVSTQSVCMESSVPIDMATAIGRRLPNQILSLIKAGISVNTPTAAGLTPLNSVLNIQASDLLQDDYPDVIKEMLSILILHGAHLDLHNESHRKASACISGTPERLLLAAACAGSMTHLCYALEKGAKNQIEALCYAARRGKRKIVEALLAYQISTNQQSNTLGAPLYYAVAGDHASLVALLVQHGANSALRNGPYNLTAFEAAVYHKSKNALKELMTLAHSEDIDQINKELTHELRVRQLCPQAKKLYILLILNGEILAVNAITIHVLFNNRLVQAAFLDDRLSWYIYCILHYIVEAKHAQVLNLVSDVLTYLPLTCYSDKEFSYQVIQTLENYLDAIKDVSPLFLNNLVNIFEFIIAKRAGKVTQQVPLSNFLEKTVPWVNNLKIEHKQILLGTLCKSNKKVAARALCVAATQGHFELLNMLAPLVDSKTLLKALDILTIYLHNSLENS